jgi:hypothetical protein
MVSHHPVHGSAHRFDGLLAIVAVVIFGGSASCAHGVQDTEGVGLADATGRAPSPRASSIEGTSDDAGPPSPASNPDNGSAANAALASGDPSSDDGADDASDGAAASDDASVFTIPTDPLETGADGIDGATPGDDPPAAPTPGDLAITEVMFEPSGPEPDCEWFEIYNLSATPKALNGLTIQDGYDDTHVITSATPVVVAPGAYALLVRDEAAAVQTLVPMAAIVYAYGTGLPWSEGIELDDGNQSDLSLWNGTTLLAYVPYGAWDASYVGQSIELKTPQSSSTDVSQWCLAQAEWAPGSDYGTPGASSDCGP